ncbi:hypothetical protein O6H91_13G086500 [Diphasiastrum complanatum]|uniref:Uncharacterized protein n=1 Tax=Diphasiastrum complanatum TaxID=34168 RepID=A0ACC2BXF2_DIPCM|nr:hypothetical protein O6H91_13G086500 [Diphasiastrum complanatum]
MSHMNVHAVFYADSFHPIQAGSIDGTDTAPHDNGVYRALLAASTGLYDPTGDRKAEGDPYCTLFVGRLSRTTDEKTLEENMSKYGRVKHLRLVRHIVTGASRGYAFIEFETEEEFMHAYEAAHYSIIDGSHILVDYNRQQLMPGWIPRRLGGGLGGRKESGQLRFGGRDRPFRAPLRPIPHEELKRLGIPLPPEGHYMSRHHVPPPPQRRQGTETKDHHRLKHGSHRSINRHSSAKETERLHEHRPDLLQKSSKEVDLAAEEKNLLYIQPLTDRGARHSKEQSIENELDHYHRDDYFHGFDAKTEKKKESNQETRQTVDGESRRSHSRSHKHHHDHDILPRHRHRHGHEHKRSKRSKVSPSSSN